MESATPKTEIGPIVGMDLDELQAALGPSQPKFRAQQIYDAVYRHRAADLSSVSNLPKELRGQLRVGLPEIDQVYTSTDGTRRYLFRLDDGKTVEAVWMPEGDRSTICISTQVGCPVDCKFCLTALLGLERNLTAGEIVGQVLKVAADRNLEPESDRLNLVFMGQGEPFLNLPSVLKAVRLLCDQRGPSIAPRRITVSTSGILNKFEEFAQAEIRPRLAISLNASTEEQRREIMPVTRKWHLNDLIEACRTYPLKPRESITFEYVMLKGVNDTDEDARRVVRLLANLKAKVNLIALNPGPGIPYETPDPERVNAFHEIVCRSMPCFVRKPRGLDVYAACGQLKRMNETQNGELPVLA